MHGLLKLHQNKFLILKSLDGQVIIFAFNFFFVLNSKRNKMRREVVSIQVPLDLKLSVRTIAPLGVMLYGQ